MEKKGDLLTQIAVIVDLLELLNIESKSSTITFELTNDEYYKTYNYLIKKVNSKDTSTSSMFTIKMGEINLIFNRNNDEPVQSS